jgi:hypothetical protein
MPTVVVDQADEQLASLVFLLSGFVELFGPSDVDALLAKLILIELGRSVMGALEVV